MPWDKFSAAGNRHRATSVNKIGLALTSKGSESKVIEYRRNLSVVDKVFFFFIRMLSMSSLGMESVLPN